MATRDHHRLDVENWLAAIWRTREDRDRALGAIDLEEGLVDREAASSFEHGWLATIWPSPEDRDRALDAFSASRRTRRESARPAQCHFAGDCWVEHGDRALTAGRCAECGGTIDRA